MRSQLFVLTACAVLAGTATTAEAQRHFSVGLAAGAALPTSEFNESHKPGFSAAAHVGFGMPASAVGFRLEGLYHYFDNSEFLCVDECVSPAFGTGPVRVIGATANALFHFGGEGTGPYLIGGVGTYSVRAKLGESNTDIGLNAGVGGRFRVGIIGAFIEGRLHAISSDPKMQFIPITFGIEF